MLSPCSQPKMPRTEINPGWPCFPKKPLKVLENEGRICQSRNIDTCLTLRDEPDSPILIPHNNGLPYETRLGPTERTTGMEPVWLEGRQNESCVSNSDCDLATDAAAIGGRARGSQSGFFRPPLVGAGFLAFVLISVLPGDAPTTPPFYP